MKWERRLRRNRNYSSTQSEETLNGQGYDTEKNDQEETSQDGEGKAG